MKKPGFSKKGMAAVMILLSAAHCGTVLAADHSNQTVSGWGQTSYTEDGDITVAGINGWNSGYTGDLVVGNATGTGNVKVLNGINTRYSNATVHGTTISVMVPNSAGNDHMLYVDRGKSITLGDAGRTETISMARVNLVDGSQVTTTASGETSLIGVNGWNKDTGLRMETGTLVFNPNAHFGEAGVISLGDQASLTGHATEGITFNTLAEGSPSQKAVIELASGATATLTTDGGTISMDGYTMKETGSTQWNSGTQQMEVVAKSNFTLDGAAEAKISNTDIWLNNSDLLLATKATGGTIQLDALGLTGTSAAHIGNQSISDLSITTLGTNNDYSEATLKARNVTIGKEGNYDSNMAVGGMGKVNIEAGNDVAIYAPVTSNENDSHSEKTPGVSIQAGGNVTIDSSQYTSYNGDTSVNSNGGEVSITAGGDVKTTGNITTSYKADVTLQGANITTQRVQAGDSQVTLTAKDAAGNLGSITTGSVNGYYNSYNGGEKSSVTMTGDDVMVNNSDTTGNPGAASVMLANTDLTIDANDVTLTGYTTSGTSVGNIQAKKSLVINAQDALSNIPDEAGYGTVTLVGDSQATFGTETADVTINGRTNVSGHQVALTVEGAHVTINHAGGTALYTMGKATIGSEATRHTVINGNVVAISNGTDAESLAIKGENITADGTVSVYGDTTAAAVGTASTKNLTLKDKVTVQNAGGKLTLDGQHITAEKEVSAGNGAAMTVGSDATESVAGTYLVDHAGSSMTVRTKKLDGTLRATNGAAMAIGSDETEEVRGTLTAEGTDSVVTVITKQLEGTLKTSQGGTLAADIRQRFTGTTQDAAQTMTLDLSQGAVWNNNGASTIARVNANGGTIDAAGGTGSTSLTIGTYTGMDGTLNLSNKAGGDTVTVAAYGNDHSIVTLDYDAAKNSGNDAFAVTDSLTGSLKLRLKKLNENTHWSEAMNGTVLAYVPQASLSHFALEQDTEEQALHFYKARLFEKDNPSNGLAAIYLRVKKDTFDENSHHTSTVRNLAAVNGSNYLLWRSDMDTLFRRIGEVHGYAPYEGDDGLWVRARGTKFSRDGEFSVSTRYNQYEIGYDWLAQRNEKDVHLAGIGFAYLDGDATYHTGKGDVKGYTLGLYDTHVWDDGQHLDLVLKGQRLFNDFHYHALGTYGSGTAAATGFSLGAEYGYKMKDARSGWFAEPQGQIALGWLQNSAYTDSNGVHVDGDTVRTALGRIGARAGYEGPKFQAFVKANWYHDFGGNSTLTFTTADDALRIHEDYGDTWFEYGLGIAWNLNRTTQLYADIDRGDGSSYDKDWSWDIGLRWNF